LGSDLQTNPPNPLTFLEKKKQGKKYLASSLLSALTHLEMLIDRLKRVLATISRPNRLDSNGVVWVN